MAVRPLDRQEAPGPVGQDVEWPLPIVGLARIQVQVETGLGGFVVPWFQDQVEVLPVRDAAKPGEL